jgi:hypothetical protein
MQLLLEHGTNANVCDDDGDWHLYIACCILPLQHTINGNLVCVHVPQSNGLHYLNAHDMIKRASHSHEGIA